MRENGALTSRLPCAEEGDPLSGTAPGEALSGPIAGRQGPLFTLSPEVVVEWDIGSSPDSVSAGRPAGGYSAPPRADLPVVDRTGERVHPGPFDQRVDVPRPDINGRTIFEKRNLREIEARQIKAD